MTLYPRQWVKLAYYCQVSGEAPDAVHARRRTGKWLEGYHWQLRDGHVWVNLPRADEWVEHGEQTNPRVASRSGRTRAELKRSA